MTGCGGQWCRWCGHWCYVGEHLRDGRLDYSSIPVSQAEVEGARRNWRSDPWRPNSRIERNIALGKHIGVYGLKYDVWGEVLDSPYK